MGQTKQELRQEIIEAHRRIDQASSNNDTRAHESWTEHLRQLEEKQHAWDRGEPYTG